MLENELTAETTTVSKLFLGSFLVPLLQVSSGAYLVVVGEVARLALALGVEQALGVRTGPRVLIPAELAVTRGAHVLGEQ